MRPNAIPRQRMEVAARLRLVYVAFLVLQGAPCAAAPSFTVDGQPILGSFAFTWEPDDLRQALDTGVNLVFCYDHKASKELLDPASELGRLLQARRAKAMYNLLGGYRYPLAAGVTAEATEIPLAFRGDLSGPGTFWMGDEAIRFTACRKGVLEGCQRGALGTMPAPHPAHEYVLYEEPARKEILAHKDSPNLWGYWVMDDKKQRDVRHALRNLYRLIKRTDVDASGVSNRHVVVAGMANVDALTNFDAGTCDMIGVYAYPAYRGVYRNSFIPEQLAPMQAIIARRCPGIAWMGIFQAFTGEKWTPRPTAGQLRQQVEQHAHFGASALMAYSWRTSSGSPALGGMAELREELGRIIGDLRAGRIPLDQPWPSYPARRTAQPDLAASSVLADFDGPSAVNFRAGSGVTARQDADPDGRVWVHMDFNQYAAGKPEWPGVTFNVAGRLDQATLATSGWLVATVHNYQPSGSEVGITVIDSAGRQAGHRYHPLAPNRITHVSIPLNVLGRQVDLCALDSLRILMRRPPVSTHLAFGGLLAAPMQFEVVAGAACDCPHAATFPRLDGDPRDACWSLSRPVELEDDALDLRPSRPSRFRLLAARSRLGVVFEGTVSARLGKGARGQSALRWTVSDDSLECFLRNMETGDFLRVVVDPTGRAAAWHGRAQGQPRAVSAPEMASVVEGGRWCLEMEIDLAGLGSAEQWGFKLRRNDAELGPLVWPKDPTAPEGVESLGTLQFP